MAYQSKYTGLQIDDILDSVEWKQGKIEDLASIRAGAQKGATALQSYTEKYTGTVTGIKINGVVKSGSGIIDLGTISTDISGKQDKLVDGVNIATINGQSLTEGGDLTIEGGAKVYEWFYDGESESVTLSQEEYDNIVGADIVVVNVGLAWSCIVNKSGKEFSEAIGEYALTGQIDMQGIKILLNIRIIISTKVATITAERQEIPTKTSQLENDSNFITSEDVAAVALSGSYNDLQDTPTIPSAVTESTVSGWGFTKNTGTYSKPSGGIPKSDLASAVQTSLGKADTALQSYTEQYKGTVTGVKINGTTKNPSSGVVDLGTVITAHQTLKTINGESIVGSGDITISGGSNEDSPLKLGFDENTGMYAILPANDEISNTWYLPGSGGSLINRSEVMYKLEHYVVGSLPEIYACANGEIDSTFFEKGPVGSEGVLPIVTADIGYIAGIVSGAEYNDDDTMTFSIYTYDGKCIVITTSDSDEYIYTDDIRIIDFANLGGGSSSGSGSSSGTVTSVKINGQSKSPSSGVVDLGYINKQLSTSTSSSMTLSPNIYYRNTSTSLSTLTITLGSASNSNIINEYFVEFTTRSTGTTVSLPSTIKWANGEVPTFEASTTYQISIVNNLGTIQKFK